MTHRIAEKLVDLFRLEFLCWQQEVGHTPEYRLGHRPSATSNVYARGVQVRVEQEAFWACRLVESCWESTDGQLSAGYAKLQFSGDCRKVITDPSVQGYRGTALCMLCIFTLNIQDLAQDKNIQVNFRKFENDMGKLL